MSQTEEQGIDRLREAHVAALNTGNVDAFAGLFADDGVQMPPSAPANVGRAAVRAWAAAFMGAFRAEFSLSVAEVRVLGDWAFERGGYTINLIPRSGDASMRDIGKYITIYQRQPDGAWQMARDIWNSNAPPPGSA
jgi:uncharacterized protein (TIGR02246 family)